MRKNSNKHTGGSTVSTELVPKCLEAEQSVIGSALHAKRLLKQLLGSLSAKDFYSRKNQVVYQVLSEYMAKYGDGDPEERVELGVIADIVFSGPHRREHDDLVTYITSLVAFNQKCSIEGYVKVIRKNALLREAIEKGSGVVREAYAKKDPVEIAVALEQIAKDLARENESGVITLAEAVEKMKSEPVMSLRYATGIIDLDNLCGGGLSAGGLFVIAGRPGMGKTMLAINIARAGIARGKIVGFFSLEMTAMEIAMRFKALEESLKGPGSVEERLKKYCLHIRQDKTSVHDVEGYIEKLCLQGQDPALIVIDYLQLMSAPAQLRREEQISYITRNLKSIALQYEVPIIVLSQLNRECEKRTNSRPVLSDLRESGAIEQDADMVMFLYRDELYNENTTDRGIAELIIAKNRNGRAGVTIRLVFRPEQSRFMNMVLNSVEPPF